jgi:hypothetical protein
MLFVVLFFAGFRGKALKEERKKGNTEKGVAE